MVSVEKFFAQGIVLHDFECFVKSDAGVSFLAETAVSVRLEPGAVLLVPFGYVAMTTLVNDFKNQASSGHLTHHHVLAPKLAANLSSNVWNGIFQVNDDYLKGKTDEVNKVLHARFTAFAKSVNDFHK